MKRRTAILISGGGSNMEALIRSMTAGHPAQPVLVVSNRPGAGGLDRAARLGVPTAIVDHRPYGEDRAAFESKLDAVLSDVAPDILCLAGFMRLLGGDFVSIWQDRMINIHPSLLPAFKGLHTHERVLEAGVRITGCTVHFVRPEMDAGPIIAQAAVPVAPGDTADTLADRVLAAEHATYPKALAIVASGRFSIEGDRVSTDLPVDPALGLFVP